MKKCLPTLPRIAAGILFVYFGATKLFVITVAGFAATMVEPAFGVSAGFALVLAWIVVIAEILGGFALLLGCRMPKGIYKTLLIILALIIVGSIFFVHLPAANYMEALKDLVIGSVVLAAFSSCGCGPTCPIKN